MTTFSPSIPDSNLRSNIRNLYLDVFWWGVLGGSTISFLNVFATRLGATSWQIGLLTAGPAIGNLLVSLPASRWLEGRPLIRSTFYSSIANRVGYLPLIVLPWLLPAASEVWAIALIVLVMSVPGAVLAIAFNSMFAEVVPADRRGHAVGWRSALVSASIVGTSLLCGWLLDWIAFPLNYQVVFAIGALGAGMSSYHLSRIRAPSAPPVRKESQKGADKPLLRLDLLRGTFGPFIGAYLLFYICQNIPVPLFPLAFVRELSLTDGAISLGNALFYLSVLLISMRVGRISDRWGHRRVLLIGSLLYSLYPLLLGSAQNATLFWLASFLGGIAWALTGTGLINRLMERVPPDDLPAHMALHNLALNAGLLGGSLIGPLLGNWLGLRKALWLSAALRLLSGALFGPWG
jgi:MFS family permease